VDPERGGERACCGACGFAAAVAVDPSLAPGDPHRPLLRLPGGAPPRFAVVVTGQEDATHWFERDEVRVGRSAACELSLRSDKLSRFTCAFTVAHGVLHVRDTESACGTYLNGRPIRGPVALREGDRVDVADFTLLPLLESAPRRG